MASLIPRCRPLLRRSTQMSRLRSAPPSIRHAQNLSKPTPSNQDDTKQRGPEDERNRDTGSPFNTSTYNPKDPNLQLPTGWRGQGGREGEDTPLRLTKTSRNATKTRDRQALSTTEQPTEEEIARELYEQDMAELEDMYDAGVPTSFLEMEEDMVSKRGSRGGKEGVEDLKFDQDDITTLAHAELEQHRELREFYRTIVWDMPLLYNHRKAFQPPTAATPLRFRYTTYMGETHPAARKVVCDFTPSALPDLTQKQVDTLIKILGPRYNPEKDRAKISCEMFPTPAQNKRYIGDLIDTLVHEVKNGKDSFEDIPFDFRHMKRAKKAAPAFPEEWKMTEQRRLMLESQWAEREQVKLLGEEQGTLVNGAKLVEAASASRLQRETVPIAVQQGGGRQNASPQRQRLR